MIGSPYYHTRIRAEYLKINRQKRIDGITSLLGGLHFNDLAADDEIDIQAICNHTNLIQIHFLSVRKTYLPERLSDVSFQRQYEIPAPDQFTDKYTVQQQLAIHIITLVQERQDNHPANVLRDGGKLFQVREMRAAGGAQEQKAY